jgi:hypothetical protein
MNFQEILDEHHVVYHTSGAKCRTGWLNMTCPYCDKSPYLGYSIEGRFCNCWNCGWHSLGETLHFLTRLPLGTCYELIGRIPRSPSKSLSQHTGKLKYPVGLNRLSIWGRDYIERRGMSSYAIQKLWNVQEIGIYGGLLRWRLFIPVHQDGMVVTWTARSINPDCPHSNRYRNASKEDSAIPIDECIYGIDYVRQSIILVEGPIDVWRIGPGAGAVLGLKVSPPMLERLSRASNRLICFDNEPDAQARARKLMNDLSVLDGSTTNIILETGNDPASASLAEIESLRKEFLCLS